MSTQDFLGLEDASPQPHRIVPISASESLHASTDSASPGVIPTGLPRLDEAICRNALGDIPWSTGPQLMGVLCGHVTEVFGPSGVGKTSLALSIACNALRQGAKVVWIDTGSPIPKPRLKRMLQKAIESQAEDAPSTIPDNPLKNLVYFRAQSLPHLLALLMHPPKGFPSDDTTLLVVDSISALFPSYFPNPAELKPQLAQAGVSDKSQVRWLVNRRWNVTSDLGSQLMKLASTHRLAVFLINQTHTKIKGQPRATLCPALSGGSWDNSIYTRIVLYRDFPEEEVDGRPADRKIRIAEVLKRTGKPLVLRLGENIVPFTIESDSVCEIERAQQPYLASQKSNEPPGTASTASQRKRKVDEIADSQDEDESTDEEYGWVDGDDTDLFKENSQNL